MIGGPAALDLQPEDERTALVQQLRPVPGDQAAALVEVPWEQASSRLLPTTDMTIGGIVRHLAWAEDRWFQGRLHGSKMPAPWDAPGADDPDHSIRLVPGDTTDGIVQLYGSACKRSRAAVYEVRLARSRCPRSRRSGGDRSTFAGSSFT